MGKKICLFTAHSPLNGGGATIIRSLVDNLPDYSIDWTYISHKPVLGFENGYLGSGIMGGKIVTDIWQTYRMLKLSKLSAIDRIVAQLLAIDCETYWIISHNEGIRVAFELSRIQKTRPVHLTFHDDWAGAICARSNRYRFLARLAHKLTVNALKVATSFDVISQGMQSYYYRISRRQGEVCHRFLPELINNGLSMSKKRIHSEIHIGHIGSIYDVSVLVKFLTVANHFAETNSQSVIFHAWGSHLPINRIPKPLRKCIIFHDNMPEDIVIVELMKCDFVYAMYPLKSDLLLFAQTSLPTKLSSYTQSRRPILGHGPADSSLAHFLQTTGTGILWNGISEADGVKALNRVLSLSVDIDTWQTARTNYFGEANLQVMCKVLG